jgi:hypothetical protein
MIRLHRCRHEVITVQPIREFLAESENDELACLMTFYAVEAKRNRWERVAALSSAARDGSRNRRPFGVLTNGRDADLPS